MPRQIFPKDYYSEQACKCAAAALASTIADIRVAYLNLEQGWLHLAPDTSSGRNPSTEVAPTESIQTPAHARSPSTVRDANRQGNTRTDPMPRNHADAPRSRFTPASRHKRRNLQNECGG
jgi:hypothetical protein